jgi:hypothetical protein
VLPRLWLFLAFSATDVAVFVTRFTWFGRLQGAPGASQELFEVMVLLRAAVLVWCVVSWIRHEAEPLEIESRAVDAPATPAPATLASAIQASAHG